MDKPKASSPSWLTVLFLLFVGVIATGVLALLTILLYKALAWAWML